MTESKGTSWFDWAKSETDPSGAARKPEALDDLLVLDVSYGNIGGLVASSVLAEMGARVIRVEPSAGDIARRYTPFGFTHNGVGLGYLAEARNKYHITLNLEHPGGRELFKTLARQADALIETYPPGTMDQLGLGYRQLREINPRLIYAGLGTYGQFGPRAAGGRPGSEISNQAYSGLVFINGEPATAEPSDHTVPTKVGSWYGWYAEGLFAAYGILIALLHREETGRGQMIDVSGAECIMKFIDYNLGWFHMGGQVKERLGNHDPSVFPYTFIQCREGHTFIAAYNDEAFKTLTEIAGRPELADDPRFASFMTRTSYENEEALHRILEEWSTQYPVDEVIHQVQEAIAKKEGRSAAVVTGKVCNPSETLQEQNWWQRGTFRQVEDPCYGSLTLQGPLWKMSESPPRLKWVCRPPGHDNAFVYSRYLGVGPTTLRELRDQGVV